MVVKNTKQQLIPLISKNELYISEELSLHNIQVLIQLLLVHGFNYADIFSVCIPILTRAQIFKNLVPTQFKEIPSQILQHFRYPLNPRVESFGATTLNKRLNQALIIKGRLKGQQYSRKFCANGINKTHIRSLKNKNMETNRNYFTQFRQRQQQQQQQQQRNDFQDSGDTQMFNININIPGMENVRSILETARDLMAFKCLENPESGQVFEDCRNNINKLLNSF